jgi:uncharacterized protein YndB with AHSA1/START domain
MTPTLDIIAAPGSLKIVMSRMFDAPRDLVFKAYTDPKHLTKWWGLRTNTTTVDVMDVRPGGMWRFVQRNADGEEFAFHGVYHAVTAPETLVHTFEFEGMPGHVLLETITFEDHGDRTKLIDQSVFQSVADRDGMVASGMEAGANETMDRFAELLATL